MNPRKLLCLLLALCLVLSIAACADDDVPQDTPTQTEEPTDTESTAATEDLIQEETVPNPEEAILGSWVAYIYITEENTGLEGFETEAGLPALVTFEEDGIVTMVAYEEALDEAYDNLKWDLCEYMITLMYEQMEDAGYTKEEVDERFEDIYGITLTEYAEEAVERLDLHDSFLILNEKATYELTTNEEGGNVLILNGKQELTFEVRSSTITFLDSTKAEYWEAQGMVFPVILERVDEI